MRKTTGAAAVVLPDNVLFFDSKSAANDPWTQEIWSYEYRTNGPHSLKRKPLRFEDLAENSVENIAAGLGRFRTVLAASQK